MKKIVFLSLILAIATSCNVAKNPQKAIKKLSFLEGKWQQNQDGVNVIESWESSSDAIIGTNILVVGRDTLFHENIKIASINGVVTYKSTMGKYVVEDLKTLPLTRCTAKRAVFGSMNKINSTYICYKIKGNKLNVEMRDLVDFKIIHDKYGLTKVN